VPRDQGGGLVNLSKAEQAAAVMLPLIEKKPSLVADLLC